MLFQEQQKILASGKLLPPDKVYFNNLNNQLTIVNPSPMTVASVQVKTEPGLLSPQGNIGRSSNEASVTSTVSITIVLKVFEWLCFKCASHPALFFI